MQLHGELARHGGIDSSALAQLWAGAAAPRRAAQATEPDFDPDVPPAEPRRAFGRPKPPPPSRGGRARSAPPGPADAALRMLLLHSEWWEQLDADDHELLHGLPGAQGAVCAWLERQLHEHGNTPWAVLQQALLETEWADDLPRLVPDSALLDQMQFADLRRVLDRIWLERLKADRDELAARAATDPSALQSLKDLNSEYQRLLDAVKPPPAAA
jgi:DNA primase